MLTCGVLLHQDAVAFVCWSPDDSMLLTCGNDFLVYLWDVKSGECFRKFARHTAAITACAWMPDGRRFVTGGYDKNMCVLKPSNERNTSRTKATPRKRKQANESIPRSCFCSVLFRSAPV
jgi:WD40 repeat protein